MEVFIALVISTLIAVVSGVSFWKEYNFFKKAILLQGIVCDIRTERSRNKNNGRYRNIYAPVVRVEWEGGFREVVGSFYSSTQPRLGEVMTVGVNPLDTQDMRVKQKGGGVLLLVGVLVGLLGMVLTLLTILGKV